MSEGHEAVKGGSAQPWAVEEELPSSSSAKARD